MKQIRRGRVIGGAVACFGLGALVGSIAALLYAPAAGQLTRKRIATRLKTVRRQAVALREDAGAQLKLARKWVVAHMPAANGNGHARRMGRRPAHA